ncbi:MAG: hypothetical protein NTV51_20110 [Verrucomicrobia bacterium]|nr:hypothetical protein [Verrucomicrobiota bacterium]
MRFLSRPLLGVALLAVLLLPLSAQPRFLTTDLGPLGGSYGTDPYDLIPINASGQVALWQTNATQTLIRAVSWKNGVFTELGSLATDPASKAWGLNDAGVVVGSSGTMVFSASGTASFSRRHGVVFGPDGPLAVGPATTAIYGINSAGVMAGESGSRPILFDGTTVINLGSTTTTGAARAINAAGQIVGYSNTTTTPRHAFLYENGKMRDLGTLGGPSSSAEAVNAAGQIVGFSARADGVNRAFLYSSGQMSELPTIPAGTTDMRAYGINARGQIIGFYMTPSPRPFLYEAGVTVDLNSLVSPPPGSTPAPSGFATLWFASGINDAGQITGAGSYVTSGTASSSLHAFLLTPAVTVSPAAATFPVGGVFMLDAVPALPASAFQWLRNGTPVPGATLQSLLVVDATVAHGGAYACRITTASGDYLSASSILTAQTDPGVPPSRLINLSVLSSLGGASDTFTLGTVVGGAGASGPLALLARATGPSLAAFGLSDLLTDPRLEFFSGLTRTAENNDWAGDAVVRAVSAQVGAFSFASATSRDASVYVATNPPGDKSVRVSGTGPGTVLAEIYDATPAAAVLPSSPRLVNLSVLKPLGSGLTVGFVIAGTASKTVLVRAVGPTLAADFSLPGAVADPRLTLFSGPVKVAENDNWSASANGLAHNLLAARSGAFFFANGSKDAALVATLAPGSYTVVAEAVGATGIALVEVYEVP